ncbi:carbon storage regulator [Pseudomonas sp. QL9]|uniref:carbon storage regulator n=1 Tax=Pseudomonas sp. QL9 TaxID=3242725 RepID=UPI00352A4B05
MLSLTRNVGQSIRVGDDIQVKILRVKGRSVVLGIQAGDDVAVHHLEICRSQKDLAPDAPTEPVGKPSLRSLLAKFLRRRKNRPQ